MISTAHKLSAGFVLDPAYSAEKLTPAPLKSAIWLYPRAAYESFLLVHMYEDMIRARLVAGYSMDRIAGCCAVVYFRRICEAGKLEFEFTHDVGKCTLDGESLSYEVQDGHFSAELPHAGLFEITLTSMNPKFCLPALKSELSGWTVALWGEKEFLSAEQGGDPHGEELPTLDVPLKKFAPGRFDSGRELFGIVEIHSASRPEFGFGESLAELENRDLYDAEQTFEVDCVEPGVYRTRFPLAFRYIRAEAPGDVSVVCHAYFTPQIYRGAFAADDQLTKIWMSAAYTLRICQWHFLVDGMKRDRLPWMGDHLCSMLSTAYAFGDPELCKRTLTVLGHPGIEKGHVNGIVDFTLWLLIASNNFQLYWNDREFLQKQYPELKRTSDSLLKQAEETVYLPAEGTWMFLDWTPEDKLSALQILFWRALQSMAKLAERVKDAETAQLCRNHADKLKEKLFCETYDLKRKLFFAHPGKPEGEVNRYANFIAILSGFAPEDAYDSIRTLLLSKEIPEAGTPFMLGLEILAIAKTGARMEALERIRTIWGGMLDLGATTFWEGYSEKHTGKQHYEFYGRPYANSLCHAWSSGPTFLLPQIVFGCEPLEDGWTKFRVDPIELSEKQALCVPTPAGAITVERNGNDWSISAPDSLKRISK